MTNSSKPSPRFVFSSVLACVLACLVLLLLMLLLEWLHVVNPSHTWCYTDGVDVLSLANNYGRELCNA